MFRVLITSLLLVGSAVAVWGAHHHRISAPEIGGPAGVAAIDALIANGLIAYDRLKS